LVKGLALDGGFGRDVGLTKNGCHFFVDAVGLPVAPTNFEKGVFSVVEEGEEIVALLMLLQEAVLRIVLLVPALLVDGFGTGVGQSRGLSGWEWFWL
jgi:hypothetical protein